MSKIKKKPNRNLVNLRLDDDLFQALQRQSKRQWLGVATIVKIEIRKVLIERGELRDAQYH